MSSHHFSVRLLAVKDSLPAELHVKNTRFIIPKKIDGFPYPMYNGIIDIIDSLEDFNTFFASKNYIEKVYPDKSNFIDLENVVVLVSKETIIE